MRNNAKNANEYKEKSLIVEKNLNVNIIYIIVDKSIA